MRRYSGLVARQNAVGLNIDVSDASRIIYVGGPHTARFEVDYSNGKSGEFYLPRGGMWKAEPGVFARRVRIFNNSNSDSEMTFLAGRDELILPNDRPLNIEGYYPFYSAARIQGSGGSKCGIGVAVDSDSRYAFEIDRIQIEQMESDANSTFEIWHSQAGIADIAASDWSAGYQGSPIVNRDLTDPVSYDLSLAVPDFNGTVFSGRSAAPGAPVDEILVTGFMLGYNWDPTLYAASNHQTAHGAFYTLDFKDDPLVVGPLRNGATLRHSAVIIACVDAARDLAVEFYGRLVRR